MSEPVVAPVYCANHPDRETGLRCHRCDKPICYQCAIKTPVGQICPECYKAAQAKYYNGDQHRRAGRRSHRTGSRRRIRRARLPVPRAHRWISFIIAFIAGPGRRRRGGRGDPASAAAAACAGPEGRRNRGLRRRLAGRRLFPDRVSGHVLCSGVRCSSRHSQRARCTRGCCSEACRVDRQAVCGSWPHSRNVCGVAVPELPEVVRRPGPFAHGHVDAVRGARLARLPD